MFEDGLYDRVVSEKELIQLETVSNKLITEIEGDELAEYLSTAIGEKLAHRLKGMSSPLDQLDFANSLLSQIDQDQTLTQKLLRGLVKDVHGDQSLLATHPEVPLSQLALLTNAKGEPGMGSELVAELHSAQSVDILMSFIKVTGLRVLYAPLLELKKRGVKVRVLTSTYIGATEKKALDQLVLELGAEVKIDYFARQNRLHAKAWMLNRSTGFSTAFIGSSNMSSPALSSGVEWNVRLSEVKSPELLEKFKATFDTYWNGQDFGNYDPEVDGAKLEEALARAAGTTTRATAFELSNLEVVPQLHQIQILEDLAWEREKGHHKNLVVAATGSGKTVVAALDFKRERLAHGGEMTLLFVAHSGEILRQARRTFAEVLRDNNFGEFLVGGEKPVKWRHVFATVQSLKNGHIDSLNPEHFDFLVVDEVHHAEAPTYKKLLEQLAPKEVLGLTATPERSDGINIQNELFDGRIASELRLWDALDAQLLTPFHYFGIGESTDYTGLRWVAGKYDATELSNVVTGNHIRDRLMFQELERKVPNLKSMRALFFCADVKHAEYISELLNKNGIASGCVTGATDPAVRKAVIGDLAAGRIQAITAVDVFNEGFDLPNLDTLVMLRPTESPLVFLQQLGRGLRRYEGKDSCLVLDFVGAHRAEYRVDKKLSALTGRARGHLIGDLESGFPYLPSGVSVSLDEIARNNVLSNLKAQVSPRRSQLVAEIQALGHASLREFLAESGRDLEDIYRFTNVSWSALKFDAGLMDEQIRNRDLASRIKAFTHVNDWERLNAYTALLVGEFVPWAALSERERRYRSMFFWLLWRDGRRTPTERWKSIDEAMLALRDDKVLVAELVDLFSYLLEKVDGLKVRLKFSFADIPLFAHANYTLDEMLGASGYARVPGCMITELDGPFRGADSMRQGVAYVDEIKLDLLTVTLNKSSGYSATTRYRDFAEARDVFHWESQSTTTLASPTGQRYVSQRPGLSDVLLAIREEKKTVLGAQSYRLAGLCDYVRHEGEAPISIWWKLRLALGVAEFKAAAAVNVA